MIVNLATRPKSQNLNTSNFPNLRLNHRLRTKVYKCLSNFAACIQDQNPNCPEPPRPPTPTPKPLQFPSSLTSRSSLATSLSSMRMPSSCSITIFMWLRMRSLWLGISEGSWAGARLLDILHRRSRGGWAEGWARGQAEPRPMSGATRSRSATDPITDPISDSGHAGGLQHLKNTRRARKAGGAWAQASSCTALSDVQEFRRKRTVERKM